MATKKATALNDELLKLQDENTKLKAMVYNLQEGNKQLEVVINDLKTAIQELAKKHYGKPFKSINIEDRTYTLD